MKTWQPMKVEVVGDVTQVVLNKNKHSGDWKGSTWSFPTWSFPTFKWPR